MHVVLFFTYGVSLCTWKESGLLKRELSLYQKLYDRNVRVSMITYGDINDRILVKDLNGIKLYPYYEIVKQRNNKWLNFLQSLLLPFKYRAILQSADILKTNQLWGAWNAVLSKWLWKKPLMLRCGYEYYDFARENDTHPAKLFIIYLLSKILYKSADLIHTSSQSDAEIITRKFNISPKKVLTRSNWVDTELFCFQNSLCTNNRVLFVGRLNKQKNLPLLFKALENTSIGLDIIGSGEEFDMLLELSKELKIDVNFIPPISNDILAEYMTHYSVFVLCSKFEGNPKSLLEAMACGLAVIGTDVPGIRNIIVNESNGLLVSPDPESLRTAILKLNKDAEFRVRLGKAARNFIKSECTLEEYVSNEIRIYDSLTGSK